MLAIFPLGLLAASLVLDLIRVFSTNGSWSVASYYAIGAGVIGGLLAAVLGRWNAPGYVAALGMFLASWILRRPEPSDPGALALVLSGMAVLLAVVMERLEGESAEEDVSPLEAARRRLA